MSLSAMAVSRVDFPEPFLQNNVSAQLAGRRKRVWGRAPPDKAVADALLEAEVARGDLARGCSEIVLELTDRVNLAHQVAFPDGNGHVRQVDLEGGVKRRGVEAALLGGCHDPCWWLRCFADRL